MHIPLQKTTNQTCARTSEAWRFVTEEGLLKRHLLKQIVLRMKNRALGLVWDVLLEHVEEARLARIYLELQVSAPGKNVRAPDPPAPPIAKTLRPLGGVGIWLATATSSQGTQKTYVKGLVPGSPAQLSAIDIKDVLVRVDKCDLRASSAPDNGTQTAQFDTKLSSINSLIRGQAGTTVELEFVSEMGQQKIVTLRRVATAGPPTTPFPLHQSPWVTPEGKRISGPAYSDMKTPRERLLFAQFSSLASGKETLSETETLSSQQSGKKVVAWGSELDLNSKTKASDEITGKGGALKEWNEEKVYSRGDVSQLLFTASKERNEKNLEHVGRLTVRALSRTRTKIAFEAWLLSTIAGADVREACTLCGQPKLQREDVLSRTLSRTQLLVELV